MCNGSFSASTSFAICPICDRILSLYSIFLFFAILGMKDRILYLIQGNLNELQVLYFLEIFAK